MIRLTRAALFASCALTLSSLSLGACTTLHGLTGHHSKANSQATTTVAAPAQRPIMHGRFKIPTPSHAAIIAKPVGPDAWPQTYVDLPPDPAMRFGTLANGLRYVVMKNATPGGQASLRLRINAGSLEETDAQQGLAHFLEHMAFNGSTHVPRGDMVKILERHGLAFGADTNASTSWEETVYKLDLPKADNDTVESSLMLLREIAGELKLDQGAIDSERGVILSEERLRDTPGYRLLKQTFGVTLKDQLAARRFPIGQVEVIEHASHDQLEDFYRKYYRPERAVLIAVGDFDPDVMEARIEAKFSDWKGSGPAGLEPILGAPERRGAQTKLVVMPGAPHQLQMDWVSPPDLSPDSKERRRRETFEALGLAVLNRRLDRLARAEDPPFISAGVYASDDFHSAHVTTLQAVARPGEWAKTLAAADAEQRRLIKYGVSPAELAMEIDAYRATLKAGVEGAATRVTPAIADDIVGTLAEPQVETSPAEDLALFDEAVKGITPADIASVMKTTFGGSGPLVVLSTPEPIVDGDKALAKTFAAAQKAAITPPVAQAVLSWPYTDFGTPSEVAEQHDVADLDTIFVRFKNGVRLTIKPTKLRDDQILVQVRIGSGLIDLPKAEPTAAWAAPSAFPEAGFDQISSQDADQVLRSHILSHSFAVGENAFALDGTTRPDDLDTQMQVLAAYVAHPGWRPEAFMRMHNAAPTILDQMAATPAGVLNLNLSRLLHSGDQRWGLPTRQQIAAETPASLKALLAPALANGPIEVVIVGDTTVDKAIEAVAATFGALPPRPDATPANAGGVTFPPPGGPIVLTHKGRSDQAVGFIAWPTDDFLSDTQKARTLAVLSAVMQLRVTEQLRKAEGVTYSPSASSQTSDTFTHFGYLSARVEIPPAKLDGFFSDIAAISADLRDHVISADELDRAKGPAFESLEKRRQTNEYWLGALAGAQTDPRRLTAIRTSEAQLSRVTAEDVRKAAQTYLRDDKAWKLVVKP
jgi:zinc protease